MKNYTRICLFLLTLIGANTLIEASFVQTLDSIYGSIRQTMKDLYAAAGRSEVKQGSNSDVPGDVTSSKRSKRQTPSTNMIGDESPLPYEVRSSGLPMMPHDSTKINTRYMPTLSNGYIGATVGDEVMYLNGLYEGTGENSHRAMIPNLLMGRVNFSNANIEKYTTRKFSLNALGGYYTEIIDSQYAYIEHRMYAHQKYIRLFVSEIYARRKEINTGSSGIVINVKYPDMNVSSDVRFEVPRDHNANKQVKGTTLTSEAGTTPQTFFMFYMEPVLQLPLIGSNNNMTVTMVMSVDNNEANSRSEFEHALSILGGSDPKKFFQEHLDAWQKIWNSGRVEVHGDTTLAKLTWFTQYYLLSSLPAPSPALPPQHNRIYYGCSRTSLAKGCKGKDYQGHVMWDNEMYILPAVLPFQPLMAKKLLRYRSFMAKNAAENAKRFGAPGYHYPYASAFSGHEVSPDTCTDPADGPSGKAGPHGVKSNVTTGDCNWRKQYVTAGVNWAIRQYWSMTRDRDYMINPDYNGCDITREVARFLGSRAVYNPRSGRYEMYNLTGPDEWHPNVNFNTFTVVASSLAIHWARYFACLCPGRNEQDEVPDELVHKAIYLHVPYDNVKRMHYQHEGFTGASDGEIKQADTIMLSYPLNWNVSDDIKRNDLDFYEKLTSPTTPAMTWSWFTIGYKFVNEVNKMNAAFLKSYQSYLVQPFKIWTEHTESKASDQAVGNVNFLPGMGGYIQSLVYGYAGVRIRPDKVEFHNPIPPQGVSKIILYGFNYLQNILTITVEADKTTLFVNATSEEFPLILRRNVSGSAEESLTKGATVVIDRPASGFFLFTTKQETCEHPRDYIFMPWGYSPFVNQATRPSTAPLPALLLVQLTLMTIMQTILKRNC